MRLRLVDPPKPAVAAPYAGFTVEPLTRETLANSLAARSLTAQSISLTGDYAKLQLSGVQFANLMAWLEALRADSRVAVQEASVSAQSPAGTVDAVLTLRQGGAK